MPTKEYDLEFKGSVTPTATSFLKPSPLVMDFNTKIELDETDAANLENLKKAFQTEMATRIKEQLKHLNQWLAEKDKIVGDLVKQYQNLKKTLPFPNSQQEAKIYEQTMKQMEPLAEQVKTLVEDYTKIVQDWGN